MLGILGMLGVRGILDMLGVLGILPSMACVLGALGWVALCCRPAAPQCCSAAAAAPGEGGLGCRWGCFWDSCCWQPARSLLGACCGDWLLIGRGAADGESCLLLLLLLLLLLCVCVG